MKTKSTMNERTNRYQAVDIEVNLMEMEAMVLK